jgi:hypothetical protein
MKKNLIGVVSISVLMFSLLFANPSYAKTIKKKIEVTLGVYLVKY